MRRTSPAFHPSPPSSVRSASSSASSIPDPSTRSVRPSSHLRPSNRVHAHSHIHPLTISNLPPFTVTPYHSSIAPRFAPSTSPPSPTFSTRGRCTPSLPSHAPVDPTANAPPPFVRLLRPPPLQSLGEGEVAVRREAGWLEEEEGARRVEEEERVAEYRRRVRGRVREREWRRRQEEEERTRSLPLSMQQLVYGRGGAAQAECRQQGHEQAKEQLTCDSRPLVVDDLRTSVQSESFEAERRRLALLCDRPSRAEEATYQRRIHCLASLRERQEALRIKAAFAQQRQRPPQRPPPQAAPPPAPQSPSPPPPPPPPPARPAPNQRHFLSSFISASMPVSPRHFPSTSKLPRVWDELQRRLLRLDVAIGPLCACSQGGGQGVGRGLVHLSGCQWRGREDDYARALLRWCEELERARGEEAVQRLREQLNTPTQQQPLVDGSGG